MQGEEQNPKPPSSIPRFVLGSSNVEAFDTMMATRQSLLQEPQKKLLKVQQVMKIEDQC